jgi:hypothetical protein
VGEKKTLNNFEPTGGMGWNGILYGGDDIEDDLESIPFHQVASSI